MEEEGEASGQIGLGLVHFGAEICNILARIGGGQFGGCSVFVGGADVHDLVALGAAVACVNVRWQLAANKVSKVFDAVNVWQSGGDEGAGHLRSLRLVPK